MSWDALVAGAQGALTRTLASSRTITYTSKLGLGSVDLTGRALFRAAAPKLVQTSTGAVEVQGEVPMLGVRVADLPGGQCHQGDTVVVSGSDGGTFRVGTKLGDGEGSPDLELEAVL